MIHLSLYTNWSVLPLPFPTSFSPIHTDGRPGNPYVVPGASWCLTYFLAPTIFRKWQLPLQCWFYSLLIPNLFLKITLRLSVYLGFIFLSLSLSLVCVRVCVSVWWWSFCGCAHHPISEFKGILQWSGVPSARQIPPNIVRSRHVICAWQTPRLQMGHRGLLLSWHPEPTETWSIAFLLAPT